MRAPRDCSISFERNFLETKREATRSSLSSARPMRNFEQLGVFGRLWHHEREVELPTPCDVAQLGVTWDGLLRKSSGNPAAANRRSVTDGECARSPKDSTAEIRERS